MKKMLIDRLDSFNNAPFTIQRISELLSDPRKQYSRIDKFMRAVEKTILVVSTVSPTRNRSEESENGDSLDSVGLNGDFSSDVNVDIDMENDGSFTMSKEFSVTTNRKEANHDVVTVSKEVVTIKKIASKQEEATTSTVVKDILTDEPLEPTKTDVIIESQSAVTITACADASPQLSEEEIKVDATSTSASPKETAPVDSADKNEVNKSESIESNVPALKDENEDDGLVKLEIPQEPVTTQLKKSEDPKIDDEDAPLRPVDDETLVDSSLTTTPLAALENIVANRTDPAVIEAQRFEEQIEKSPEEQTEEHHDTSNEKNCQIKEVESRNDITPEETHSKNDESDDSEIETKRIKIEETDTNSIKPDQQQAATEEESLPQPNALASVEEITTEKTENLYSIIEEPLKEQSQPINKVHDVELAEMPAASEPIIDDQPVTIVNVIAQEQTIEVIVAPTEAMEPETLEMEITAPATNKMDTDEAETETNMDFEDLVEPMDQ